MELPKAYNPKEVEDKIIKFYEDEKLYLSTIRNEKPFTIVIPPPNITGSLHMGHALNNTLQDVLIRYKKICGFNTLWLPGTDHGGIATQNVVEKNLLENGITRHNLGREKFLEKMWEWKNQSGDTILYQLKKLGCLCDWSKLRFTMDEVCSRAVKEAFIRLYKKGKIYRGRRLVNWCVRCSTALADIEVEYEKENSKLWYIKYPLITGDFIVVATTRPETMLGDAAVCVNPSDERYKKFLNKNVILPLMNRIIPIISDNQVDMDFGTGALKVTPSHDPVDFQIAKRHNLPHFTVIGFDGRMTEETGVYKNLDRFLARKKIIQDLKNQNLLLKEEDYQHSVGKCYRCGSTIEPLESEQWFLDVKEMSQKAIEVVKNKKIRFYPPQWEKPYIDWLENLQDWCLSRQIWWGHRIPVWYCKQKECKPILSVESTPQKCPNCGNTNLIQDPDVLDTWFSSALWPLSVFGWPNQTEELKYYYPTSVLVTGYEILYLWVARMVQMGVEFTGEIPFEVVYIHGIVRDKSGKKMSKSLGNVIDPLEIMERYGTDALRFALTYQAQEGNDIQLSEDHFISARNFANKIWNASRYVITKFKDKSKTPHNLLFEERWILSEYHSTIKEVKESYENFDLSNVCKKIYNFFWHSFCDWYIEISKFLDSQNTIIFEILEGTLKMLHPIMPFITEEIFQKIGQKKSILFEGFPQADIDLIDYNICKKMEILKNIIISIRNIRAELNISYKKFLTIYINSDYETKSLIEDRMLLIKNFTKSQEIFVGEEIKKPQHSASGIVDGLNSICQIFVPLKDLIDIEKEKARLNKLRIDLENKNKELESLFMNSEFLKKAPPAQIKIMKERKLITEKKLLHINSLLEDL